MWSQKAKQLVELSRRFPVIRCRDLKRFQIPQNYLGRLVSKGLLQKIDRGLYSAKTRDDSEYATLLAVSHKASGAVVCLLSALRFHQMRAQLPLETWIAIDVKAWTPKLQRLPIRVVRLSGKALHFGVQEHMVGNITIRVFSPAKTVADCFKFRKKIGIEVAVEALHECHRTNKANLEELHEAAKVCRVSSVMRPYIEAIPTN